MDYAIQGLCLQYLRALAGYVGDGGGPCNRLLVLESLGWERRWARALERWMVREGWIEITDDYTVYLTPKGHRAVGELTAEGSA